MRHPHYGPLAVELLQNMFNVSFVVKNPHVDIQHDYINLKSEMKILGLGAKSKNGRGQNIGSYDDCIALKHVLMCFSSSKSPIWSPNTTILI